MTFHDLMYFSKHWLTHPSSCGFNRICGLVMHLSKQFSVILLTNSVALATANSCEIWSCICCFNCCDCTEFTEEAVEVDGAPNKAMVLVCLGWSLVNGSVNFTVFFFSLLSFFFFLLWCITVAVVHIPYDICAGISVAICP